ncbi:MAG: ZIP family metal transporter [Lachnospiraceae bacterium]|nr:ZIP family metal transporter [Lachnospiraceae bacterium]
MLFQIFFITSIAGIAGTGIGAVLGTLFCRDSVKITGLLVSFAAGIMLSVVCFNMISDALLPENAGKQMSIFLVNTGIALGFCMVWGLNGWIQKYFPNPELMMAGVVMILAIAIHNLPEGMIIGASFAADTAKFAADAAKGAAEMAIQRNASSGLILAVVIGIHNIPEGMAVAVALVNGGISSPKAILAAAGSGIPTVLGALLGWKLGTLGPVMLCLMLSFAAGAMLYVVMGELIPEALQMWKSRVIAASILMGMLTGMVIIFS